ncbi:MAG: HAMP domain-containing protein [bacterium]|nr:HAMP domain-containing protein [bacterium]
MIKTRSIRFRLTLWYSVMLFVGMALLGPMMWLGVHYAFQAAVDERLDDRLEGIAKPVAGFTQSIRGRIRALVSNPELAATVMPELRGAMGELQDEQSKEAFVQKAVLNLTEGHLGELAAALPEGEVLEIRDPEGRVLASRMPNGAFPWPETDFGGEPVHRQVEYGNEDFRLLMQTFEVDGQPYQFLTATSLEPIRRVARRASHYIPWVVLAYLVLSAVGGWTISNRALKPVDDITRTAKSISIEDLSHRLEVPKTGDELERLAATWNEMLKRLEGAVGRLSQFTADASHELRTPTAVIRTTAELALRRQRSPEEYRQALEKIMAEGGRMTRLMEDLLTLARADSNLDTFAMAPTDLRQVVSDVCEDQHMLAEARRLSLDCALPPDAVTSNGNPDALRRLMVLLLDNAIKYTPAGGKISVSVANSSGEPAISVSDTGVGIPAEALPKIFERFFRADASRSRATGSFGLGLSVAKWIADRHHATIEVESAEGSGSIFRIRFHNRTTVTKEGNSTT